MCRWRVRGRVGTLSPVFALPSGSKSQVQRLNLRSVAIELHEQRAELPVDYPFSVPERAVRIVPKRLH
jgi:hypothetical protein